MTPDYLNLPIEEMEQIVRRFNQRIGQASAAQGPTKAWVKKALHRKGADRCPTRCNRPSLDLIIRYGDALADLYCQYPDDVIGIHPYDCFIGPQPKDRPVNTVHALMRDAQWTDEWGTTWGHAYGGVGATHLAHPIQDWSQLDDYIQNRIPDPRLPGRLDGALPILQGYGKDKYCVGMMVLAILERMNCLRGTENVLMDFYTNEKEIQCLIEALTEHLLEIIRYWAEIGADAVYLGDDWGSQNSLMVSLPMWRKFFKKPYQTLFDEVHRVGMDVLFHSCGNVIEIIPDLIELGADILDPIQPGPMDPREIGKRFGGQIAFSGGIDLQHLLPQGTPQQVKDQVRRTIDCLGAPYGNAYIVAAANAITPDVPLENLQALCEASHGK